MTRNLTLNEINEHVVKYGTGRYAVTFETGDTIQEFNNLYWAIEYAKRCRADDERMAINGELAKDDLSYYDIHITDIDGWIHGGEFNDRETQEYINNEIGILLKYKPLKELIGTLPGCFNETDVVRKLETMNTSREINWLDELGGMVLPGDLQLLKRIAQPNIHGYYEWYGVMNCGMYQAVLYCTGDDWDDEIGFANMGSEIIGWI